MDRRVDRPMDHAHGGHRPMRVRTSSIVLAFLAVLIGACASQDKATPASSASPSILRPPHGMELQSVVLPDVSRVEAPVQRQLREGATALTSRIEDRQTASVDLGA